MGTIHTVNDLSAISKLLQSGQRIFVGGSSNEPVGILQGLADLELPEHLHFVQFPIGGYNNFDFTGLNSTTRMTTFFMTPALRKADPHRLHFLPMHMRHVYDYLAKHIDVGIVQIACDSAGRLRLGPNVDFVGAVLAGSTRLVAELNRGITAPLGSPQIDPQRFDLIVETHRPLTYLPAVEIDEAALTIGRHVAGLVRDGDCIQTGIGAIPAAILKQLTNKNDLGMHGGLIDDGGMALIRAGNINGQCKALDTGQHITGMALGSEALYDWLAAEEKVVFRGANHTHEISAISRLSNFVSVNSAVEIDLFGQVNAEVAGGRQISGTGGSVDFMRGAKASPGGRSIVAMHATARGGRTSRIVQRVEMATALRTDIDFVVTEFGVARLKNLPNEARAEALIALAAPEFRNELRADS